MYLNLQNVTHVSDTVARAAIYCSSKTVMNHSEFKTNGISKKCQRQCKFSENFLCADLSNSQLLKLMHAQGLDTVLTVQFG